MPPPVTEHVPCGDAPPGIQRQRLHEEVDAAGADGAEAHLVPVLAVDGVLAGDGEVGQLGDAGPVVLGGGPDGLAYHLDLVELVVAREEGGAEDELGEDGADGPDVDGAAVVLGAEEQLGGPVPARDDVGRHVLVGVGEAAGEAKVCELDVAVGGDEKVVGLDVAVEHEVLVAEPDGAREHAHPGLDVGGAVAHAVRVADEHLEVAEGQVLEDEVEVLVLGGEDAEEGDDVGVAQLLEVLELADRVGRHALGVLLLHLDLLDGHERRRPGPQVAQEDDGVGSLAELLALGVLALLLLVHLLGQVERRGQRRVQRRRRLRLGRFRRAVGRGVSGVPGGDEVRGGGHDGRCGSGNVTRVSRSRRWLLARMISLLIIIHVIIRNSTCSQQIEIEGQKSGATHEYGVQLYCMYIHTYSLFV